MSEALYMHEKDGLDFYLCVYCSRGFAKEARIHEKPKACPGCGKSFSLDTPQLVVPGLNRFVVSWRDERGTTGKAYVKAHTAADAVFMLEFNAKMYVKAFYVEPE